jgi:hypothetical protein
MNKPLIPSTALSRKQKLRTRLAATLAIALCSLSIVDSDASGGAQVLGRATRSLTANDEAHLHYVSESGSNLAEEGTAIGSLPGTVKVRFTIGAVVEASFTIYPRGGGSLSGHGSGTLHLSGIYASFGGTMSVSSGTGRYGHARGTGGFYGVINRNTSASVVQTRGTLSY